MRWCTWNILKLSLNIYPNISKADSWYYLFSHRGMRAEFHTMLRVHPLLRYPGGHASYGEGVFGHVFFYFPCVDTGNQYQTNCNFFFFLMGFKGIFFLVFCRWLESTMCLKHMKDCTSQFLFHLVGVIWLILTNELWVELSCVTLMLRQWKALVQ